MNLRRLLPTTALVALTVAACGAGALEATSSTGTPLGEPPDISVELPSPPDAALEAARARWQANGPASYDYTYRLTCFCPPERRDVQVRNGVVVPSDAWTVEAFFDRIAETLAAGKRVQIDYDETYGHPVAMSLDLDAMAADGGFGLVIESFDAVQTDDIDAAFARWTTKRPDFYSMTYDVVCFCPKLTVSIGVGGDKVFPTNVPEGVVPATVDMMFAELFAARDAGAAEIRATFDETDGHPLSIWIDADRRIVDEERGYAITSFVPMLIVPVPSTTTTTPPAPPNPAAEALAQARALWAANGPEDYDYHYRRTCFCPPPNAGYAHVRDGVVTPIGTWTVEELFDRIESAIVAGGEATVSYDPVDGHPTTLNLDPEPLAVDDEFGLTIDIFETVGIDPAAAIARWNANRPAKYRMTFRASCFCPSNQTTLTVEGTDIVASATDVGFDPFDPTTVDDMLAEAKRAGVDPRAIITGDVDPTYGYPRSLSINPNRGYEDDGATYRIIAFEALG